MSTQASKKAGKGGAIVVTSLMLFSMFFGAGNLIFPPVLGASAGENFAPALIGFLITGVALPIMAIFALARTGSDIRSLAGRGGAVFGVVFPALVYLSIGAFYAVPRTATVSYTMFATPVFGVDSQLSLVIFALIFFAVSLAICLNPSSIVDALGKFLTPALVLLLALLVVLSLFTLTADPAPATEDYASAPFVGGFLQGYFTMDSLAGLAFGIILVSSLKHKGLERGKSLMSGVAFASLIAGLLLALVYLGLGWMGRSIENGQGYEDGAALLSDAAHQVLGQAGAWIFGLIVLLACLTTAVGLLSATSEFFSRMVPAMPYRLWLMIFTVIGFLISTLGLSSVLAIAAPILGFLYPPAITLIILSVLEPLLVKPLVSQAVTPAEMGRRLSLTFKLALFASVIWAALMTLNSLGWGSSVIEQLIGWSPWHALDLGWVVPTLVLAVLGYILDFTRKNREVPAVASTAA